MWKGDNIRNECILNKISNNEINTVFGPRLGSIFVLQGPTCLSKYAWIKVTIFPLQRTCIKEYKIAVDNLTSTKFRSSLKCSSKNVIRWKIFLWNIEIDIFCNMVELSSSDYLGCQINDKDTLFHLRMWWNHILDQLYIRWPKILNT